MFDVNTWFITALSVVAGTYLAFWWFRFALWGLIFGLAEYRVTLWGAHDTSAAVWRAGTVGLAVVAAQLVVFRPRSRLTFLRFKLLSLKAGEMTAGAAWFKNTGVLDARVSDIPYVQIEDPPPADAEGKSQLKLSLFDRFINGKVPEEDPEVVPSREQHVQLCRGAVLSGPQQQALETGEKAIYFLGRVMYRDRFGQSHTEYCWYWHNRRTRALD